jgi:hypothetical protein
MHCRTILHDGVALGVAAPSPGLFAATRIKGTRSTDIWGA